MSKVADKILAQYIRFQHYMLEGVLKGSVDPIALMNAQRQLIGQKTNLYLRLISVGETITIPACEGGEKANIYHAKKTFPGDIDCNFDDYGINLPQPPTEEIDVDVYEMYNKNADLRTLFGSLSSDLKSLAFESQEQIKKFVQKNERWLCTEGHGTSFLFTEVVNNEEKFFVACVNFDDGLLAVFVDYLSDFFVWNARFGHRIVVPATRILKPQYWAT